MNALYPMGLPLDILAEEFPNEVGYLVAVLLEREVSGVEQVKLQILQVFLMSYLCFFVRVFYIHRNSLKVYPLKKVLPCESWT
jgi:hypothetical protein